MGNVWAGSALFVFYGKGVEGLLVSPLYKNSQLHM